MDSWVLQMQLLAAKLFYGDINNLKSMAARLACVSRVELQQNRIPEGITSELSVCLTNDWDGSDIAHYQPWT